MQCGIEVDIENQTDLIRARAIQERLMRGTQGGKKDGLDYAAESRQLHRIGGDCFDCLKLSEDRFCFIVGDASGKGTAAALMISSVQTSLRLALSFLGESPVAAMATANSYFHTVSLPDCYVTIFCGVYDRSQRTLRYVNAGHNPPILLRQDNSIEWLETGGAPVGMFDSWSYAEGTVTLKAGDVFVAYTDGITEASNAAGEEWGSQGLEATVRRNGGRSAAAIVQSLFDGMNHFAGGIQADDATALVFRADGC